MQKVPQPRRFYHATINEQITGILTTAPHPRTGQERLVFFTMDDTHLYPVNEPAQIIYRDVVPATMAPYFEAQLAQRLGGVA